jgi:23S rRNA (guanosine2251-2'-O)-methyltransferase
MSKPRAEGKREARALGGEIVVGRQAVRELLRARRRPVRDVWVAEGTAPAPVLDEIDELAHALGLSVRLVPRQRLEATAASEAPQGVSAHAAPLPEVPLAELTASGPDRPHPFLLLLDGVTDPHNLGAVLRTGACAGVTGVVLPRHRSALVTPTVTKAAAGAVEYLPMSVVPGMAQALTSLAAAGVWTVGLDASARTTVFDLAVATEAVALVLGSEATGMSRLVRARCDVLAGIPQFGAAGAAVGSLNVAAAAAVACFAVARRRSGGDDQRPAG